jgi:hypothetical protein
MNTFAYLFSLPLASVDLIRGSAKRLQKRQEILVGLY